MPKQEKRGSDKLIGAWKARTLTEASVMEIADALEKSPAKVEAAGMLGGGETTGIRVSLTYEGDDAPYCGNDIAFWLKWHLTHGGYVRPPRIIINGTPWPELIRMELEFGNPGVNQTVLEDVNNTIGVGAPV
jgi:hypothetical protein